MRLRVIEKYRLLLLLCFCLLVVDAISQTPVCAYCNRTPSQLASSGHASNCPYYVKPSVKSSSVSSSSGSMEMMVTSTILQSLFSSIMQSDQKKKQAEEQQKLLLQQQAQLLKQKQLAEQKRLKDSVDKVTYDKLMQSYKLQQGAEKLGFKKLDGDMETLSKNARNQFDGASLGISNINSAGGTPFFGTKMDSVQIKTLINPDEDSIIKDINDADIFIKQNKISDSAKVASLKTDSTAKKAEATGEKKSAAECEKLKLRLNNYLLQRDKFHKVIQTTHQDLNEWKKKNNDAMWNAVQTGFDLAFSKFLDKIAVRSAQAENVKDRLLKFQDVLRTKGVDVDTYLEVLNTRIFTAANLAKDVSTFKDAADYDAFFRDAMQSGVSKLAETDTMYQIILNDAAVKNTLNEGGFVELDALQFGVGKVFEKMLSSNFLKNLKGFSNKIPYVSYAQFVVDQTYNALDMYLSYQQIIQLREVAGQETRAAMSQQMSIDKTIDELKNCSQ